jgi:hypothetical protein
MILVQHLLKQSLLILQLALVQLLTISSLMIRTKAAPSLICEELPAVTLPPASKTGRNPARASLDVPALGPSSLFTT